MADSLTIEGTFGELAFSATEGGDDVLSSTPPYLIIEGALGEIPFSAVEDRTPQESAAAVATITLAAVSPVVSGGVQVTIPAAAAMTLSAVSPVVTGGIAAVIPEVATMALVAVPPAILPSIQTRGAIKGVFGFELHVIADVWEQEPKALGQFGTD